MTSLRSKLALVLLMALPAAPSLAGEPPQLSDTETLALRVQPLREQIRQARLAEPGPPRPGRREHARTEARIGEMLRQGDCASAVAYALGRNDLDSADAALALCTPTEEQPPAPPTP